MTDTMARPRATRNRALPGYAVAFAAWAAVTLSVLPLLADPPRRDFGIRNDTRQELTLAVRTGSGSVTSIATVDPERSRPVAEVLTPGDVWHFVWRVGGNVVGTSSVPDARIRSEGFTLSVPDSVQRHPLVANATPAR